MVVLGHLWPARAAWAGWYAVFAFYVLSGWLMAMVLSSSYPGNISGTLRFLANRALRIYPPYLVILLATIGFVLAAPGVFPEFHPSIRIPGSAAAWLKNLLIFGLNGDAVRLVPPAWSLDVELWFYVLMGIGLARTRIASTVWFISSVALTVFLVAGSADFSLRFASIPASSLPFSLGAALYHFRERLQHKALIYVAGPAFFIHFWFADEIWQEVRNAGFYVSLFLAALCVVGLSSLRAQRNWSGRMDSFLGDLAYPIFLSHQLVAGFVIYTFPGVEAVRDGVLFWASLPVIHVGAWLVSRGIEHPTERLRTAIRPRPASGGS